MDNKGICAKSAAPIQRTKALQEYWNFHIPAHPTIDLDDLRGCKKQLSNEIEEIDEITERIDTNGCVDQKDYDDLADFCIDMLEYVQQLIVRS